MGFAETENLELRQRPVGANGTIENGHAGVPDLVSVERQPPQGRQRPAADGSGEGPHTFITNLVFEKLERGQMTQRPAGDRGGEGCHASTTEQIAFENEAGRAKGLVAGESKRPRAERVHARAALLDAGAKPPAHERDGDGVAQRKEKNFRRTQRHVPPKPHTNHSPEGPLAR